MRSLLALAITAIPLAALARSGPPLSPVPATLRTSARADVSEVPNRAQLDIGVTTQALQARVAVDQNARRLEAVIIAIRRHAGADAQLKTGQLSLVPDFRSPGDGKTPTIIGYTVTHRVSVQLDDLGQIGSLIDAAIKAGANRVDHIRFTLRNPEAARVHALRKAVLQARAQARALAAALDLRIVRIVSVNESAPVIVPFQSVYSRALAPVGSRPRTPIEPGSIQVRASVTLEVQIAPRR